MIFGYKQLKGCYILSENLERSDSNLQIVGVFFGGLLFFHFVSAISSHQRLAAILKITFLSRAQKVNSDK